MNIMRKKNLLTSTVMRSIETIERKRISSFQKIHTVSVFIFFTIFSVSLFLLISTLHTQGTLDTLSIFMEDLEIIRESIFDVLFIITAELPPVFVLSTAVILLCAAGILISSKKTRTIIKQKESDIRKYFQIQDKK